MDQFDNSKIGMNQCHVCSGKNFYSEITSEVFQIGGHLMLVEHIPMMVCDRCDKETFDRETMERVRALLHGDAKPTRTVEIGVFSLSPPASRP